MAAQNNLLLRILSGVCLGTIVICGVVWSNFLLNLLLAVGAVAGGIEWTQIVDPATRANSAIVDRRQRLTALPLALFLLWAIGTRTHAPEYPTELLVGSVLLFLTSPLGRGRFSYAEGIREAGEGIIMRPEIPSPVSLSPGGLSETASPRGRGVISTWLLVTAGFPIVGATILSLIALHQGENWHALIFLLSCVSATDIGAFAVGKVIGGPKLAPRISPNKTRAGAIGGMFFAALVAASLSHWLGGPSIGHSIMVGLCISVLTQGGDLTESALKRRFSVKDSGFLIPGHGGILDRIDGLLLAAPVFTLYSLWLGGSL